ncbi:MAG: KpsF/GutQ family sugar-phosphate isomerase [Acidobacteriota bacterium]
MGTIETGKEVLDIEAGSILHAKEKLDHNFDEAVNILFNTTGRIVVTGMGKSGLVGKKISATLTSTGSPSIFLHPSEAMHGDIGIINKEDTILALSTSGETQEVIRLLNFIKRIGAKLIALVGDPLSSLAKESDVFVDCGIEKEACPIGLVPTASTTLSLAVGDALAVALMKKRGFGAEDFRYNHPGGNIGKKLLKVKHCMHAPEDLPIVKDDLLMKDVIKVIDKKKFGVAIVINGSGKIVGILTDGDLRRAFLKGIDFENTFAGECMTKDPATIQIDKIAVEALNLMEEKKITSLIVAENGELKGLVHLHDLWRTEMI